MSAFYLIPWGFQSLKGLEHKYFLPAPQGIWAQVRVLAASLMWVQRAGLPSKGVGKGGGKGDPWLGGRQILSDEEELQENQTKQRLLLFSFLLWFLPFPFLWVSDVCHRSSWFNSETCAAETVKNCNKNPDFVSVLNWTRFLFWNFYKCTAVDPEKVKKW